MHQYRSWSSIEGRGRFNIMGINTIPNDFFIIEHSLLQKVMSFSKMFLLHNFKLHIF